MDPFEKIALALHVNVGDASKINDTLPRGSWGVAKMPELVASLYNIQSSRSKQDGSMQLEEENGKKARKAPEDGMRKHRLRYHRLGGLIAATFEDAEAPEENLDDTLPDSENYGGPGAKSVIVNDTKEIMASMAQNMSMRGVAPPPMSEEEKLRVQEHEELMLSQYEKSGLVPAVDDWDYIYSNTNVPRGPVITPERLEEKSSPLVVSQFSKSPRGYVYSRLKGNSIRLITLWPSTDEQAQLQCDIDQYDLDSAPVYEALSYTWGSALRSRHLRLGNGTIEMTMNLSEALCYLRNPRTPRILWVDAVCINQNDIEERNAQVTRMNTIYQRASEVIVWLGRETDTSQAAFSFLYKLQSHCYRLAEGWFIKFDKADIEGLINPAGMRGWEALAALMDRPWWSRAWVLQEVVLATRVKVYCGHKSFPWEMLAKAGTILFRFQNLILKIASQVDETQTQRLSEVMKKCQPYINVHIMRSKEKTKNDPDSQVPSLINILTWTRRLEATNPRDNVYAILNLLPKFDMANDLFVPDYRLSVSEVYNRFAIQVLLQERKLSLLSLVFRQHNEDNDDKNNEIRVHNLPSWVPDFDIVASAQPLEKSYQDLGRNQLYHAAPPALAPFTFSLDLRTLTIYGFVVCGIAELGQTCLPNTVSGEIDAWKDFVKNRHPMRGAFPPGMLIDDFWRTILADQWSLVELVTHRIGAEISGVSHIPPKDEQEEKSLRAHITGESPQPWHNRRFFIACNGMMGLAPKEAREGDEVVVLLGGSVPFIVRREAGGSIDNKTFTFIGER